MEKRDNTEREEQTQEHTETYIDIDTEKFSFHRMAPFISWLAGLRHLSLYHVPSATIAILRANTEGVKLLQVWAWNQQRGCIMGAIGDRDGNSMGIVRNPNANNLKKGLRTRRLQWYILTIGKLQLYRYSKIS